MFINFASMIEIVFPSIVHLFSFVLKKVEYFLNLQFRNIHFRTGCLYICSYEVL